MTARRAATALAAVLAAAPAAGYVRSSDPDTGKELFWPLPVVPYQVNVDRPPSSPGAPSCAAAPPDDPGIAAVHASFSAWRPWCGATHSSPDLDLLFAGASPDIRTGLAGAEENLVVFRRGWCSTQLSPTEPCMLDPEVDCGGIYGCFEDHGAGDQSIVALTSVLYDPGTGRIFDAGIEVNGWDGTAGPLQKPSLAPDPSHGWYFTCDKQAGWSECTSYGEPDCYYIDLQNTVTHEVGHVLGLAHNGDPSTTMYEGTNVGEISKRVLSPDDVAGVCAIYPAPSGGCSCGAGAGGASASALLAIAALWPRRRRR